MVEVRQKIWYIGKGAMAISHHATSYLNPSQNAAEEAAREASTGNVSLGNTSFENSSVLTRQFAQGTIAKLHLWRGADPDIQRYGLDDDEFP